MLCAPLADLYVEGSEVLGTALADLLDLDLDFHRNPSVVAIYSYTRAAPVHF